MSDATDTTAKVQSTLTVWHFVAAFAGALVVHAYHTIVKGGGYQLIWRRFKYGPTGLPPAPPQNEEHKTS